MENDLKKFQAEINNFENALKKLKENDKRRWEGFISLKKLQKNLAKFKLANNQFAPLIKNHSAYQQAIDQIFSKFIRNNANEIKNLNKTKDLDNAKKQYSGLYAKDYNLITLNVHKELESRTAYAAKLTKTIQSNADLKAIVKAGKTVLALDKGIVPAISESLINLKELLKQMIRVQQVFGDKLKQNLYSL